VNLEMARDRTAYRKEYYRRNRARELERTMAHHRLHPEMMKAATIRHCQHRRELAQTRLGGICERCGCPNRIILEVNHLRKFWTGKRPPTECGVRLWNQVINLKRPTEKFNLLCPVCNKLYSSDRTHGAQWTIEWIGYGNSRSSGWDIVWIEPKKK